MKHIKLFEEIVNDVNVGDYVNSITDANMKTICKCTYSKDRVVQFNCYVIDPKKYGSPMTFGPINLNLMTLRFNTATAEEIALYNLFDKAKRFDL